MIRDGFSVQRHVDDLLAAHAAGTPFAPLRHDGTPLTMAEAYAVQAAFAAALAARAGTTIGGYKIGLTSPVMQEMCGVDRPIYGAILQSTVYRSGLTLDLRTYGRAALEFEVAVKLRADLTDPAGLTRELVAACVEAICPAFELIDDRNADYATLDAASLTADNSWNEGVVLGDWQPLPADLATRRGRVVRDGEVIATGLAGDVLGHPLEVVAWIAKELALTGRTVPAGAIIMTGSIARTQHVSPGQRWRYEIEGLGNTELTCGGA